MVHTKPHDSGEEQQRDNYKQTDKQSQRKAVGNASVTKVFKHPL